MVYRTKYSEHWLETVIHWFEFQKPLCFALVRQQLLVLFAKTLLSLIRVFQSSLLSQLIAQ
jgi:hypothetical protein